MIATQSVTVKLSDDQQVTISEQGIELQDARSYSPRLIAAMNLEDAIAVAQAVLALQQMARDAEDERRFERMEDERDAELFNWNCSIEADYDFIRTGC